MDNPNNYFKGTEDHRNLQHAKVVEGLIDIVSKRYSIKSEFFLQYEQNYMTNALIYLLFTDSNASQFKSVKKQFVNLQPEVREEIEYSFYNANNRLQRFNPTVTQRLRLNTDKFNYLAQFLKQFSSYVQENCLKSVLGHCATAVNFQISDLHANLRPLYDGRNISNSLTQDLILIKQEKLCTLVAFSGREDADLKGVQDFLMSILSVARGQKEKESKEELLKQETNFIYKFTKSEIRFSQEQNILEVNRKKSEVSASSIKNSGITEPSNAKENSKNSVIIVPQSKKEQPKPQNLNKSKTGGSQLKKQSTQSKVNQQKKQKCQPVKDQTQPDSQPKQPNLNTSKSKTGGSQLKKQSTSSNNQKKPSSPKGSTQPNNQSNSQLSNQKTLQKGQNQQENQEETLKTELQIQQSKQNCCDKLVICILLVISLIVILIMSVAKKILPDIGLIEFLQLINPFKYIFKNRNIEL